VLAGHSSRGACCPSTNSHGILPTATHHRGGQMKGLEAKDSEIAVVFSTVDGSWG